MYSLVLMSALSTTPDAPQFNGYFRDLFSFRGQSCYGSSCHGCQGSSCSGFGSRFRNFFSFGGSGCCGGSDSSASRRNGCQGSSCHGSSCQGSSCQGSMDRYAGGCMGSSYSCFGSQSYSCIGSMPGGMPIYGDGIMNGPIVNDPFTPGMTDPRAPIRPVPSAEIDERYYQRNGLLPDPKSMNRDPSRASVTVKAPSDGQLFCDGMPIKLTNGERTFTTPSLPSGQTYEYTFKYEYMKNGERRSREQIVKVRAGGTSVCDFNDDMNGKINPAPTVEEIKNAKAMIPSADPVMLTPGLFPISAVAPKAQPKTESVRVEATKPERAKFSVRLPAEAKLYVDGKLTNKDGGLREFTTPVLPVGQEFRYELKAEIPGPHGYPQSVSTTISFKAGETVPELNFDELLKK